MRLIHVVYYVLFFKTPLGPEIYVIKLIFKPTYKILLNQSWAYLWRFQNNENTFYTLNIDYITKFHEFNVINISTRHTKQILCNHMAFLSLKYCEKSVKTYAGNLRHLTMSRCSWKLLFRRFKDEHDVFIFCIFSAWV